MKKYVIWLFILIIGVILIYPRLKGETSKKAPVPVSATKILPVETVSIEPALLEEKIMVNGSIRADEEAELRGELSGKVIKINFIEGKMVEEGEVLLKINDSELQAEKTKLNYEIELAEETEVRQKELLKQGVTSQDIYDQTLNRLNTLLAQREFVEAKLSKTVVRAPFTGIVGLKYISEGAYLTPNSRIASIQKINPVKIDFSVPEKYASLVRTGSPIHYTIEGKDSTYKGEVYAVEPRIDTRTRTLPIRAISSNLEGDIIPGSFAKVTLVIQEIENALLVPSQAIIPGLSGSIVYVLRDNKAHAVSIKTGLRTNNAVQAVSGLKAGDQVIYTGILQLRDGLEVRVIEKDKDG